MLLHKMLLPGGFPNSIADHGSDLNKQCGYSVINFVIFMTLNMSTINDDFNTDEYRLTY